MGDNIFQKHGDREMFEMRRKASFSKLTSDLHQLVRDYPQDDKIDPKKKDKVWELMSSYLSPEMHAIQRGIVNHVEYTLARTRFNFDDESCYRAAAFSIRDRLIETLNDTNEYIFQQDVKRCYYLSLEFLIGRTMQNALVSLDLEDNYREALEDLGYNLESLYEYEHDAALGNGGLGRLAACFLDSVATTNYPVWGYGIRYNYGIFEQKIASGRQVEYPDYWLVQDNPWVISRPDVTYAVRFYGHVTFYTDNEGHERGKWTGGEIVEAVANDNPIPGFDTFNCVNLRLWKATPSKEFDLQCFNEGLYLDAIQDRQKAEAISAVLYPNDDTDRGKELRLKQQYFFCCATLQDVLRRFKRGPKREWRDLPEKVCCQLNDTHPAIAIPELMRVLIDVEGLTWDFAWSLTKQVFNYTNHTVLPEALEKWPVTLFEKLLPRHILIINEVNHRFIADAISMWGESWEKIGRMSLYEEGFPKRIRMANLAVMGSNKINGVAAIHSEIVRRSLFKEFVEYYNAKGEPEKFINVTNGVTPRRWVHCANRGLSDCISHWLGSDTWLNDFSLISGLRQVMDDPQFLSQWSDVKFKCKAKLARWVELHCGMHIHPDMLFDIQVKRIHEYKRQVMNCFYAIHRYLWLKRMSAEDRKKTVPRCIFIGGKAAPGYAIAKSIIKLTSSISAIVNNDPDTSEYFKVVFLPNYNVSSAQIIIPASDISQHISTAGTEASGTSNMKFVMNGGLLLGTLDGATVEIREEAQRMSDGEETMFIFGAKEGEIEGIRARAMAGDYPLDGRLKEVFDWIRGGNLHLGDDLAHSQFCGIVDKIATNGSGHLGDFYLVCHDFPDYCRAQAEIDEAFKNKDKWWRMSIMSAASSGMFSSDRTIHTYADKVWGLKKCARPEPKVAERIRAK